jgi:hypothetical protein
MKIEADMFGLNLGKELHQVLQASPEAIDAPGGDHVERSARNPH